LRNKQAYQRREYINIPSTNRKGFIMKITVTVPPTNEQGSYKTIVKGSYLQTYRAEALQDYNSARAHDGLEPLRRMPKGTTYQRAAL
jgi:hypothetical protein